MSDVFRPHCWWVFVYKLFWFFITVRLLPVGAYRETRSEQEFPYKPSRKLWCATEITVFGPVQQSTDLRATELLLSQGTVECNYVVVIVCGVLVLTVDSLSLLVQYINGLVQERCNAIANALESRLSCTNPSIWSLFSGKVWETNWGNHRVASLWSSPERYG